MSKIIICIAIALFMLCALTTVVFGQETWDGSSLSATGQCLAGGALRVVVTNSGENMTGPVSYYFLYSGPVAPQDGTLQLNAGESITIDSYGVPGIRIEFIVYQRPGHPGLGEVKVAMKCSATAVELSEFSAGPIPPDRNGWFGDTPLRHDLEIVLNAIALGVGIMLLVKLVLFVIT